MRILLTALVVAAVAFAAWQRRTLVELRGETARVSSELKNADVRLVPSPKNEPQSEAPDAPGVTDAELAELTSSYFAVKDGFRADLGIQVVGGADPSHPEVCETLSRLTRTQLRAVIDAWPPEPPPVENRPAGIETFLRLAGRVNPAATVPLLYELLKEPKGMRVPDWSAEAAFQSWLRHDPEGLLQWAQQAGMPEGYRGQCATWADAALVVRDPSVENVRKLLDHKSILESPFREVALKLPTPESRLTFLQNLHAATGGIYDDLGYIVTVLAERTPFPQLAHLADAAPAFKASKEQGRDIGGFTGRPRDQLGSLRLEVAAHSRDGTAAQRWEWLTQRAEDRPSGKLVGRLVDAWCKNDYPDTAAWVRALPPGPEREAVTKEVIAFLKYNGGDKLVREWESR